MKKCIDCKHSKWLKTVTGRLHPSGQGSCKFPYLVPPLPEAMYWIGRAPTPYGGALNRKENLKSDCPHWDSKGK